MGRYTKEATLSIQVLEHLFNSESFKRYLLTKPNGYNFRDVRNGCKTPSSISIDSAVNKYLNGVEYTQTISLTLMIKNSQKKRKKRVKGESTFNKYQINTYSWWLTDPENRANFLIRYTAHIAHELSHIRGFCHENKPSSNEMNCPSEFPNERVKTYPYSMGCMVENFLKQFLITKADKKIYLLLDNHELVIE